MYDMGVSGVFDDQFNRDGAPHIGPVWERSVEGLSTTIFVRKEISFTGFAESSPFSQMAIEYVEKSSHGAPCAIYFNGKPEQKDEFYAAVRECKQALEKAGCGNFINLSSGKGAGENARIESIRPEHAEKAMQVVTDTLYARGVLIDDLKEPTLLGNGFIDPVATQEAVNTIAEGFSSEINEARVERDRQLELYNGSDEVVTERSKPATLVQGAPKAGF